MKSPESEIRLLWYLLLSLAPSQSAVGTGTPPAQSKTGRRVAAVVRRRLTTPIRPAPRGVGRDLTSAATVIGLALALAAASHAQYAIDWHTVEGGGGTSTGGVYSVTGTIGQPDAGAMSGGQFTLVGGFWSVIAALQTPGAPTLRIYHTNGIVTVAWEKTAEGWVLERTNALPGVTVPWPPVPGPYLSNSADFFLTTSAPIGSAFFRLHKP